MTRLFIEGERGCGLDVTSSPKLTYVGDHRERHGSLDGAQNSYVLSGGRWGVPCIRGSRLPSQDLG